METFILAAASIVLLVPVLFLLPIGMGIKGKLLITGASLLISAVAMLADVTMPLWQSMLVALLLVIIITYLFIKRFSGIVFLQEVSAAAGEEIYVNEHTKVHKAENGQERDKEVVLFKAGGETENSSEFVIFNENFANIEELSPGEESNTPDEEEEVPGSLAPEDRTAEDSSLLEWETSFEQLNFSPEVIEGDSEEPANGTAEENPGYLSSIEMLLENDDIDDRIPLETVLDTIERDSAFPKQENGFPSSVEPDWADDIIAPLQSFPDSGEMETGKDADEPQEDLDTIGTLLEDQYEEENEKELSEEPELQTDEDEYTHKSWLEELAEISDPKEFSSSYEKGNEDPAVEMKVPDMQTEHSGENIISNLSAEESLTDPVEHDFELLSVEAVESPVQYGELETLEDLEDLTSADSELELQDAAEDEETVLDESQFIETAAGLQQKMFETMLSQLRLARLSLQPAEYEKLLKKYLHPEMPDQHYYNFAILLMEHYISVKDSKNFHNLMEELKDKYKKYPVLEQQIDYLYKHYYYTLS
ncbi:hypothetical protein CVD28_14530 [Bacillus sp. M6-12]|uniref:DUF4229 domain-containing protein n=1 Tax=Bacillus sp. M6-12 TaxID=2054166 RepID=UPI000C786668|nr:DUF4229 domain-containing protein [Bacillus sp. M6-12]PLS16869.1 hypothetical protein CVD28_14530 [Bacillus sp. M6-12]